METGSLSTAPDEPEAHAAPAAAKTEPQPREFFANRPLGGGVSEKDQPVESWLITDILRSVGLAHRAIRERLVAECGPRPITKAEALLSRSNLVQKQNAGQFITALLRRKTNPAVARQAWWRGLLPSISGKHLRCRPGPREQSGDGLCQSADDVHG